MKINITCDCGYKHEVSTDEIFVWDTTHCSCGSCHGESYKVSFGNCPNCEQELRVDTT